MKKRFKQIISLVMAVTLLCGNLNVVLAEAVTDGAEVQAVTTDTNEGTTDSTASDTGAGTDASTGTDASAGTDAGTGADASTGTDAGTSTDASAGTDAGTGTDSSASTGAGTDAGTGTDSSASTGADTTAEVSDSTDAVVITENDKPYLALGSDLTEEQKNTVLGYMGIDPAALENYDVVYINNQEEHQYLDSYMDSSAIGTKSLSSVVITKADKGSGINISTYNINYCTVGMYKNALATAGVTDANIIVAGPFQLSGTAALVGIFKAYEEMTGNQIEEEIVDAALNELVTTGELNKSIDGDPESVEALIAELKEKLANGDLDTEEDIREAINELAKKYELSLSEDDIKTLIELIDALKGLDLDWDSIANQAASWADKLGVDIDSIDKEAAMGLFEKIKEVVKSIWEKIKSIF